MLALRARGAPDQTPDDREGLRALARDWPGALRELASLPTDELERRQAALAGAAAGGPVAAWMAWMDAYHALMGLALALRAGQAASADALARAGADAAFVAAVRSPPHGRVMAAVFDHLAERFGVERATIWDGLFPPRSGPRDYRRG